MSAVARARQDKILQRMLESDAVSVQELASTMDVSAATIRRDLRVLRDQGLLLRTHGGARQPSQTMYEMMSLDSSFEDQLRRNTDEKRRIGLAAARMVTNDSVISLTPGTTTASVARCIVNRSGVTVVATAINIAMELSSREDLHVYVPGGFMRPNWFSLIGPATMAGIEEFLVDIAFVGVVGIHAERGLWSGNHDEAAVNRAMIRNARKCVVVADHTKIGTLGSSRISGIETAQTLITGVEASEEDIIPFLSRDIEVIRV